MVPCLFDPLQIMIRKTSSSGLGYPLGRSLVPDDAIPVVMVVTSANLEKSLVVLGSIIAHTSTPSSLRIVLIDCGVTERSSISFSSIALVCWKRMV
jgi:hypothetical protein